MAAPVTTIPRATPADPSNGEPRIPDTADTTRAAPMPALAVSDDDPPPLGWDDEDDDGGSFGGTPLMQAGGNNNHAPSAAPSSAQPDGQRESDVEWLFRMTGGGQAPQLQPQQQ